MVTVSDSTGSIYNVHMPNKEYYLQEPRFGATAQTIHNKAGKQFVIVAGGRVSTNTSVDDQYVYCKNIELLWTDDTTARASSDNKLIYNAPIYVAPEGTIDKISV